MFCSSLTGITVTLHDDICTFMVISRLILLRMRNVSDKHIENQNTRFMFNNFLPKIVPFEIMWKNVVELDRAQMTV
jgi:hypothetical protein